MKRGWLFAVLLLISCRERRAEIQRAPEKELPRTTPAPTVSATVTSLIGFVGEEVNVLGKRDPKARPRIPWTVAGKSTAMIDVEGSHLVIVAHVTDVPNCAGDVLLTGHVIVARGMIKQGETEGDYAEPQLDVARWICR